MAHGGHCADHSCPHCRRLAGKAVLFVCPDLLKFLGRSRPLEGLPMGLDSSAGQ